MNIQKDKVEGICRNCQFGWHTVDASNQPQTRCTYSYYNTTVIPRPLQECSRFRINGSLTIQQMEAQAWVLEVRKGGTPGFVTPDERIKRQYGPPST